jgi:hypothetical protein
MIFSHDEKKPAIDQTAYVAPNEVISGDVRVGAGKHHPQERSIISMWRCSTGLPVALETVCSR